MIVTDYLILEKYIYMHVYKNKMNTKAMVWQDIQTTVMTYNHLHFFSNQLKLIMPAYKIHEASY